MTILAFAALQDRSHLDGVQITSARSSKNLHDLRLNFDVCEISVVANQRSTWLQISQLPFCDEKLIFVALATDL